MIKKVTLTKALRSKAPDIAVAFGVIGFVVAMVETAKATPKYIQNREQLKEIRAVEENKKPEEVKLSVTDEVKIASKSYLKSIILAASSMAAIIFARRSYIGKIASITSAGNLAIEKLNEYKKETRALIGDKKADEIEDKIAEKRITETSVPKDFDSRLPGNVVQNATMQPCFSTYYGQYFWSNKQEIESKRNKINARFASQEDEWITINDGFGSEFPDITESDAGDIHGWNMQDWLDRGKEIQFTYSSIVMPDGRTALVVGFPFSTEMNITTGERQIYEASRF